MSRKPSLLASAIRQETLSPAAERAPRAPRAAAKAPKKPEQAASAVAALQQHGSYVAPSRLNKTAKTHYLPPAYWAGLEELAYTKKRRGEKVTQERLLAEALNDLFAKHNIPTVRDE